MTDEKIIQLFFQRNEVAIEETSRKYGTYCFKIANNILKNQEDSEECVNDTWLKTWETIPPTRPQYLNLFLAKIVRNLSLTNINQSMLEKEAVAIWLLYWMNWQSV